jgi:hypothetical protein
MSALRVNSGTRFNPVIPEPRTRRLHLQVRFRRIRFVAPVTRAESGNSLQGWEVDETIEERSGQGQLLGVCTTPRESRHGSPSVPRRSSNYFRSDCAC